MRHFASAFVIHTQLLLLFLLPECNDLTRFTVAEWLTRSYATLEVTGSRVGAAAVLDTWPVQTDRYGLRHRETLISLCVIAGIYCGL